MKASIFFCIAVLFELVLPGMVRAQRQKSKRSIPDTYQYFNQLKSDNNWQLTDSIPLHFTTYHTQGLTKVGSFYFLTTVKVKQWPKKYTTPVDGYDRDLGDGTGYLFKFGADGKPLDSVQLGKNEIYHPGGIDYDGEYIWVPVCEYRHQGKSIVYRIHPETLQADMVTTVADAIGAVAYNRQTNELTGMNWGSRVFYTWKISTTKGTPQAVLRGKRKGNMNPHFYIDYQDCNYAGNETMICSGLRAYKNAKGETFRLGGLELIDMKSYAAGMQLPVSLYTSKGTIITNNPFYIEVVNGALQCYFIPEDDKSAMYIYQLQ